jgi:hypothetical protein
LPKAFLYRHCEYHWLAAWQVNPLSQTVPPVHPWPPHWPQCATVPPFPPVGGCVGVEPPVVEVAGVVPELLSWALMKASACCPYSLP